jgi:opacity protein-like surface antigen
MKRLLLAGLAFSALIMPAMAADMPLKAPPPPPTWTGLYWGVNVGWIGGSEYNITNTGTDTGPSGLGTALAIGVIPRTIGVGHNGFIGGGQIGYNWQIDPSWVWGVEADFQGTTATNSSGAVTLVASPLVPIMGTPSPRWPNTSSMISARCVQGSAGSPRRTCCGTVRLASPTGKPN